MSFNHRIYIIELSGNEKVIAHQKVDAMFNNKAKKWFDETITKRYPYAVKVMDRTLAGYHFEVNGWVFELR